MTHAATHSSEEPYRGPKLSALARRIHGWSFQSFPIGMGTGAVYLSLSNLKNHPDFLTNVEIGFFCLNIFFFLLNSSILLLQLVLFRQQFKRLVTDPVKGVFVPLIVLSFATIIIGIVNYGVKPGHLHFEVVYVLFWAYISFALAVSVPMLMVWFNEKHDITTFTPAWAFLVFPLMLVGIVAINVLAVFPLNDPRAITVLIVGYVFQGLGFFSTFAYLVIYLLRVMTTGFLEGHQANGAFVACGPPGFTALAMIKLGQASLVILPEFDLISPQAGEVFYAFGILGAMMLLGLALFFFVFGVIPYWFKVHKHLNEILGCWALTFPNVGFIVTFRALGDVFESQFLWTCHAVFTTIICLLWVILISLTIYAIIRGEILNAREQDLWHDLSGEEQDAYSDSKPLVKTPIPRGMHQAPSLGGFAISGPIAQRPTDLYNVDLEKYELNDEPYHGVPALGYQRR